MTILTPQVLTISLTSAIAEVFQFILNSHYLKHPESLSLLTIYQCGFPKAKSTGYLSYLTRIRPFSLRDFEESFVVAFHIAKEINRVWQKALLAKIPSFGFTPSLTKLIASFLYDPLISVVF